MLISGIGYSQDQVMNTYIDKKGKKITLVRAKTSYSTVKDATTKKSFVKIAVANKKSNLVKESNATEKTNKGKKSLVIVSNISSKTVTPNEEEEEIESKSDRTIRG